ncbi:MAG: ribonuclease Y [Kiritimatiellia bacterium]
MSDLKPAASMLLGGAIGVGAGYVLCSLVGWMRINRIEKQSRRRLEDTEHEVRNRLKEADIQARSEVVLAREEFEKSTKARRKDLQDFEDRLLSREENLDRKIALVEAKEQAAKQQLEALQGKLADVMAQRQELDRSTGEIQSRLQVLAGMTAEEARREILQRQEKEARVDAAALTRHLQAEARETAEHEARRLITLAVQRYAGSHISEMTTCVVQIANDDAKGRIIGRDGRNVRAIEAATGVNIVIDDTPETVVISGFDPIRREIARRALVMLIADGRIHPVRIEEVVAKVRENMDTDIRQSGEQAVYDARLSNVPPDLMLQLGRLRFRTSFSQNVLQHSLEVAQLMGLMAAELRLDAVLARRIGLFHDIGKSADHEIDGAHAAIGAGILERFQEDPLVVNAVAAHHQDVEAASLYAVLCSAADAISAARPGARMESSAIYVQRLEKLEAIANSMPGVCKTFAMQAGREVRVIVDPEKIDDAAAILLARDISKQIEAELRYPGQIRVVVVRESRFVEFAR